MVAKVTLNLNSELVDNGHTNDAVISLYNWVGRVSSENGFHYPAMFDLDSYQQVQNDFELVTFSVKGRRHKIEVGLFEPGRRKTAQGRKLRNRHN